MLNFIAALPQRLRRAVAGVQELQRIHAIAFWCAIGSGLVGMFAVESIMVWMGFH
jgi:hypothetical protein